MKAWEIFLSQLDEKFGTGPIAKWVRPLKVIKYDACNLYLEAENTFQLNWFKEHIQPIANNEFVNPNGRKIKIHFDRYKQRRSAPYSNQPSSPPLEIASDFIDPEMTFSNFVFSEDNTLAVSFFKTLSPGMYNPLFLYGEAGIGKSHLLTACANHLRAQGLNVFYVHSETFTEHVVKAIQNSKMQTFREIYRHQDVLIVDDIHHLARRSATQEEFFHTFNALHGAGKQIILASHLLPSKMEDIEPRLISRFEWGIVIKLETLSKEQMGQVLKNKAALHHFPLPDPVVAFIIEKFSTSSKSMIRALEGLLMRHRVNTTITTEQAETLLADLLEEEKKLQITPEKILSATAAYFGIRTNDILGKSQAKECAFPRKLAMYLFRKNLALSYLAIGRFFQRDHSTVMTGIKQIEKKSSFPEIEAALEEIETIFKS